MITTETRTENAEAYEDDVECVSKMIDELHSQLFDMLEYKRLNKPVCNLVHELEVFKKELKPQDKADKEVAE